MKSNDDDFHGTFLLFATQLHSRGIILFSAWQYMMKSMSQQCFPHLQYDRDRMKVIADLKTFPETGRIVGKPTFPEKRELSACLDMAILLFACIQGGRKE
jgi:hypothetical protein